MKNKTTIILINFEYRFYSAYKATKSAKSPKIRVNQKTKQNLKNIYRKSNKKKLLNL